MVETRYPCPVCLGATLAKSVVIEQPELTIDHCVRCGGVWFDYGEVQHLRRCEPKALWQIVAYHEHVHQMQCHACQAHLDRNHDKCAGCGSENVLACPKCTRAMHVETFQQWTLDACSHCRGVWFDRHELAAIWKMEVNAMLASRHQHSRAGKTLEQGGGVVLDAMMFDPWLTYYGVSALGHAAEAFMPAADAAGGLGSVIAEAAGSVFETIAEIIGGIFG